MPAPSDAARALAERWQLALFDRRPRGAAGTRLAQQAGASLEFHDRRAYSPGDDLRRLDWRTYGRTGELFVKVHRDEVEPRLDLVLDASRSMAVEDAKAQRTVDLAAIGALAARRAGVSVRLIALAGVAQPIELERFVGFGVELDGALDLADALAGAAPLLRAGSVRVLVSDCLTPADPSALVRRLAQRSGGVGVLQVLAREELAPEAGETLRLIDAESGAARDLVLDDGSVERYLARLRRLADGVELECRRLAGLYALCDARIELADACRDVLAPRGVLAPAARSASAR